MKEKSWPRRALERKEQLRGGGVAAALTEVEALNQGECARYTVVPRP